MVLKTARRGERRIFNFIENSQGPGASAGVQDAPRSVSRGSEERSACIRFAMHPLEASKSVAAEVDAKIDPKNDQKHGSKMGSKFDQNSDGLLEGILVGSGGVLGGLSRKGSRRPGGVGVPGRGRGGVNPFP